MNVLFVYHWTKIAPTILPETQVNLHTGKTTNMFRFAEAFSSEQRNTVHIISDYIEPRYTSLEKTTPNLTIYRLNNHLPSPLGQPLRRIIQAQSLAKNIVASNAIDAIFFDFSYWWPALYFTINSYVKQGIPVVSHADMVLDAVRQRFDYGYVVKCLQKSAAIHTLTPHEKQQIVDTGYPDDRVFVIPNPINQNEFSPEKNAGAFREAYGIGKKEIVISYTKGREERARRFLDMAAPALLDKYDVKICMYGGFSQELIRRYDNPDILFTGRMDQALFLDAMASSDMSIILQQENVGEQSTVTRLGEIAMSGVAPVITEDQSFIWTHMQDAVLCGDDKGDDAAFKKNMVGGLSALIENTALRTTIGENARKTAIRQFGYPTVVQQFERMFEKASEQDAR